LKANAKLNALQNGSVGSSGSACEADKTKTSKIYQYEPNFSEGNSILEVSEKACEQDLDVKDL
jgi:hypothetical protein